MKNENFLTAPKMTTLFLIVLAISSFTFLNSDLAHNIYLKFHTVLGADYEFKVIGTDSFSNVYYTLSPTVDIEKSK